VALLLDKYSCPAGTAIFDQINVIAGTNNVVKAIINGAFTEDCIIDTGTCLSFLDSVFVKTHSLQLVPLKPGTTCAYMTTEKAKIRDIGTTSITLSFGSDNFVFKLQVVDRLFINSVLNGFNS